MNHDYAHCWDYDKEACPETCFRAQITEDHKHWPHPVTYSKFKGTEACPITNPQPKRTKADFVRTMTDEELAEFLTAQVTAMADVIFREAERILREKRGIHISFAEHWKPDLKEIRQEYLTMLRKEQEGKRCITIWQSG